MDARSLLGGADFYALVVAEGRPYGADSTSARVMVSDDGGHTWQPRAGEAQLLDLAVDPTDPDQMVGVDLDRALAVSDDEGDSWGARGGCPQLVELEWTSSALVDIAAERSIMRSAHAGLTWDRPPRCRVRIHGVAKAVTRTPTPHRPLCTARATGGTVELGHPVGPTALRALRRDFSSGDR